MDTPRIPFLLALGALTGWAAKAVTVGLAGGADSTLASVLMVVGVAFALAAGVGVAAILSRGLSTWRRAGAMVLGVVTGPALGLTLNLAIESVVESDHWAWAEVNLWVMAVLLVAVAMWVGRRHRGPAEQGATEQKAGAASSSRWRARSTRSGASSTSVSSLLAGGGRRS